MGAETLSIEPGIFWSLGAVVLLLVVIGQFFVPGAAMARKFILRFVLHIALPLSLFVAFGLYLLAANTNLAPQIWQAIIAGVVLAIGWLTTAIFAEVGKANARAAKIRDVHKALYPEIGNALANFWDEGRSEVYARFNVERMQQDESYIPFIPKEENDHIYDVIIQEIDILPVQTIDAIVAYYSQIKAIAALAQDMRGESFKALSQTRRIAMYEDYAAMRKQAFASGQYALRLIIEYSDRGPAAAEALGRKLTARGNNQGVARSDR